MTSKNLGEGEIPTLELPEWPNISLIQCRSSNSSQQQVNWTNSLCCMLPPNPLCHGALETWAFYFPRNCEVSVSFLMLPWKSLLQARNPVWYTDVGSSIKDACDPSSSTQKFLRGALTKAENKEDPIFIFFLAIHGCYTCSHIISNRGIPVHFNRHWIRLTQCFSKFHLAYFSMGLVCWAIPGTVSFSNLPSFCSWVI